MATVIRLKRGGRTHKPYYRIVVMDSRTRTRGVELEIIGYHHPIAHPEPISEVDAHKALEWLGKGAQVSDTARTVLKKMGVMKHFTDGTKPEEAVIQLKGDQVKDKGYNAPPPVVEKPKEEEAPVEASAEEAPAEAEASTEEAAPAEESSDDSAEEKAE